MAAEFDFYVLEGIADASLVGVMLAAKSPKASEFLDRFRAAFVEKRASIAVREATLFLAIASEAVERSFSITPEEVAEMLAAGFEDAPSLLYSPANGSRGASLHVRGAEGSAPGKATAWRPRNR